MAEPLSAYRDLCSLTPTKTLALDLWANVSHQVSVNPVDDAGINISHLEQRWNLRVSGATIDQHGNKTIERVVGICPRTAGELSRSLNRWGQFLGLQDTPAEVTQHTLIQLSAPSDGAAFGEKWSQQPVEIEATGPATGPNAQLPPAEASQSLNEALLSKQFEANQGAA